MRSKRCAVQNEGITLIVAQKVKNAQFLLKSQESVQENWKCKILLQSQKSAEKVPSTIGN